MKIRSEYLTVPTERSNTSYSNLNVKRKLAKLIIDEMPENVIDTIFKFHEEQLNESNIAGVIAHRAEFKINE